MVFSLPCLKPPGELLTLLQVLLSGSLCGPSCEVFAFRAALNARDSKATCLQVSQQQLVGPHGN